MTPDDTKTVLAKCAAFDNRNPDRMAVAAWTEALDQDVTLQDALAAVSQHYAITREWIMPADINTRTRNIRRARITEEEQRSGHLIPDGLGDTPVLEARWKRAALRAIGMGATRHQAGTYAWEQIGRRASNPLDPAPTRLTLTSDDPRAITLTNTIGRTA